MKKRVLELDNLCMPHSNGIAGMIQSVKAILPDDMIVTGEDSLKRVSVINVDESDLKK